MSTHAPTSLQISSIRKGVSKLGFAGTGRTGPAQPGRLLDGSTYHTDGLRAVLILAERRVALSNLDFFDWERLVD